MGKCVKVLNKASQKMYLIDEDTGQMLGWRYLSDLTWWQCKPSDEPVWGKVYWGHMDMAAGFFTGKAEFFFRLMSYVEAGGRIVLSDDLEASVMDKCGISKRTFTNYLNQLSKDGLIFKTKGSWRGTYWVNPFMFGFGKWDACRKQQKAFREIRYAPSDVVGSTDVDPIADFNSNSADYVFPPE